VLYMVRIRKGLHCVLLLTDMFMIIMIGRKNG
jgi:hypothetical protein